MQYRIDGQKQGIVGYIIININITNMVIIMTTVMIMMMVVIIIMTEIIMVME